MASPSVSPSGTNYQSVTIAGAWRQKDIGSAKRCVRWTRGIYGGPSDIRSQAYAIVGSNDQTTWYLVDRVSNQHTNSINRTVNASYSQYSYRYYRWIEEQMESSASYILSHWFGMFDENNAQLTTDGSFTSSNGAGDVGGNSSGAFTIDSADGTNGTFNWQQTSNYGSGTYSGPTSTLVYDPTMPIGPPPPPPPQTANGAWLQMQLSSPRLIAKYSIKTYFMSAPFTFIIVGSNNGSTWYLIDSKTQSNYNWTTHTVPAGNQAVYSYARMIVISGSNFYGMLGVEGFTVHDGSDVMYPPTLSSPIDQGYTTTNSSQWFPNGQGPTNWYYLTANKPNYTPVNQTFLVSPYYGTFGGSEITTYSSPPTTPSAPTSLSASAGNGSVSISFTQGSNGGFAITNYKYSLDGGSTFTAFSPAVTTSPISITGLTNGVSYTIQLKAVNSSGDGDASASIMVTPATTPNAPTDLVASYAGSGAVEISFTPGSDGGGTITNYQYSIDCGATFTPLSPLDGITPVTITGLTNGQSYCIELKAVNSVDVSIASSSVQYTAYGPPDAPTNVSWVDTLNGTISVYFTIGYDQGSTITNYEYSLDGGSTFTAFSPAKTTSPVSISGLNIRTHYSLALRSVNAAGSSASSETLNMYYMCFLEGTKILCFNPETNQEEYRAIETLRKGSLVKTVDDGYKRIDMIGTSKIYNPGNSVRSKNRLYKCSKENYPSLTEDLFITGCHSILVKDISEEERAELMDYQGKIYITDNHYRLIAAVDKRAEPHASEGVFNIWHMALENDNYYFNYGIYANGLLVETSSLRMMKEFSGMDLVQ